VLACRSSHFTTPRLLKFEGDLLSAVAEDGLWSREGEENIGFEGLTLMAKISFAGSVSPAIER